MLFLLWEWVAKCSFYLLSCITLVVIGWWINSKTSRFHRLLNQLPGPASIPFIGRALDFMGGEEKTLEVIYVKWTQVYGGIFRFNVGPDFFVCLSTPELIEPFLNSQKVIDKGVEYKDLVPWLGYGLLLSTGDKWRSRRRLLTPAFHFQILDSFVEVFNKQSRVLCRILDQQAHSDNKAINIHPFVTRCSLDIICEAAMGTSINAQFQDSEYVKAVYKFSQILLNKWINPLLTNQTIFSLTDDGKEYPKILNTLHTFTNNIIQKRREEIERKGFVSKEDETTSGYSKRRRALLDMLLEATITGTAQLTHEDIREEIDTFMFEGHDTVSSSMSWFLYCMATNPDHQDQVYEELMKVFGDDLDRDCTQQDLPQLKYLENCIKESLRLYPSVPAYTRILKEDFQLGKHLLPAGCTVAFLAYGMHRNPTVFPNPLVFDPQRFTPENSAGRHPYAYIPFSAGPRNCIGQRFALMEEKVVTSFLLRRFKFSVLPNSEKPIPSTQVVLKSVNGIHLVISSR